MLGAVKSYDSRRGLGALTPDGGGKDVAVYVSEVERAGLVGLTAGDRLRFDIQSDRGRRFAVNLEPL
jgi:CspA family cold shock protein